MNLIQIVMIVMYRNYYLYVIVIPVFTILTDVITAFMANRAYPNYFCRGTLDDKIKNDLKERVMGLLLGRISFTIRSSIDSMFVTAFLGLKKAAVYSNYFYIATAVAGIIQVVENALVAGAGNSIVVDSVDKNHNDFLRFTFLLQWIVGWCSVCVLCLE